MFDRNTEESRSKVSTRPVSVVDLLVLGGRLERLRIGLAVLQRPEKEKPKSWLVHMRDRRAPPQRGAEFRPQRLDVPDRFRSWPIALSRQPGSISIGSSLARPSAIAAASFSAARMPDSTALWLPLMRGTLTKPAEQPISAPPGKTASHRLVARLR